MRILRGLPLGLAALALLSGCHRHRASPQDCKAALDRLIDVELVELGYRDPILRTRWHRELERRFALDLERCRSGRVRDDLRLCLQGQHSSQAIVQQCLE